MISTLPEHIAAYDRHLKHLKSGKRRYPVHFRLFVTRLNRFMAGHFTGAVNEAWQQVVQDSNQQSMLKKHAYRISYLQHLLNNHCTGGDKIRKQ